LNAAVCVRRRRAVDRARGVVWIEPTTVVEVQYNEMMLGQLRDPVVGAVYLAGQRK
jgi:hypothetical protein